MLRHDVIYIARSSLRASWASGWNGVKGDGDGDEDGYFDADSDGNGRQNIMTG